MKLLKIFFYFILICIALGVGGYFYFNHWYQQGIETKNSNDANMVEFEVKQGESTDSVGTRLKETDLIRSDFVFKLYLKKEGKGENIQAGKFSIAKNLTIPQVVDALSKAVDLNVVRVTIIEGYKLSQVRDVIIKSFGQGQEVVFSPEEFDQITKEPDSVEFTQVVQKFLDEYKPAGKGLEGFLYPDTYEFEKKANTKFIIETLIGQFIKKTEGIEKDKNFYNVLTLASIVERESFTNEERPIIAGVFNNRLKIGMALQSDATVNYATGKSDPRPTYQDLKVNSLYNTYKYPGLPPGPICNPRIESIQAAASPAKTGYFYFIHEQTGTGQVHFAKTVAEHEANKAKYLD